MSNRHLPAGPNLQGGGSRGSSGADISVVSGSGYAGPPVSGRSYGNSAGYYGTYGSPVGVSGRYEGGYSGQGAYASPQGGGGGYSGGSYARRGGPPAQYAPQYQQQSYQQQMNMYGGPHQQQMNNMYNYPYWQNQQYYGAPNQQAMPVSGYPPYQSYAQSPPPTSQAGFSGIAYGTSPSQHSPALATPYQPPSSATFPNGPSSAYSPQAASPQVDTTTQKSETNGAPDNASPSTLEEEPLIIWGFDPSQAVTMQLPSGRDRIYPLVLPWQTLVDISLPKKKYHFNWRLYTNYNPKQLACFPREEDDTQTDAPKAQPIQSTASSSTPAPVSTSSDDATSTRAPETPTQAASVSTVDSAVTSSAPTVQSTEGDAEANSPTSAVEAPSQAEKASAEDAQAVKPAPPAEKPVPFSWAAVAAKPTKAKSSTEAAKVNGNGTTESSSAGKAPETTVSHAQALAEAIHTYNVDSIDKATFLEPRGLVNTGKMCYMNSVLQVLVFCLPFYDFLDQVKQRAVYRFNSSTPLLDAMIMFLAEYKIIKSASTAEQLRQLLKSEDLEKYGDALIPEFVYEAIKSNSRFDSMRIGQEQDAEEFLGFLLQTLDDECSFIMKQTPSISTPMDSSFIHDSEENSSSGDWLEVGRKQRAAVTRSTGSNSSTPVTKIFGGLLRSEFRVPGLKDSITMEPYQPLQLDIGPPEVRNVSDALRRLSLPERLHGDFKSPQGRDVTATKQVFIETLPPVLILHLKRFQFDATSSRTMKSLKKIDYPLELEIPREVLPRQNRSTMGESGAPKYRLISVVYHHGSNASEGHYTADVRRQDGREWVRIDDCTIRRVRSEDVAAAAAEDEAKDTRKENTATNAVTNRYGAINDEDTGDDSGWKQVTTSTSGSKRTNNVANGTNNATPKGKQIKDNIKDNKVAYLLFYQRI